MLTDCDQKELIRLLPLGSMQLDSLASIAFALFGAGIVIYQKRKPKFTPGLQRLGEPATCHLFTSSS